MKRIKAEAVIFDLDGTIIDTLKDIAASINTVLARHSLKTYQVEEYKKFIGRGSKHLVSQAFQTDDEEEIKKYYDEYLECYLKNIALRSNPYPTLHSSLKKLSIFGYKLYVLTNKPTTAAQQILKKVLPDVHFTKIITPSETIPPKPDATGLKKLIKEERLDPNAIVYFGDSDVDMQVAKEVGIPNRIGCLYGYQDEKRLKEGGATKILTSSKDLLNTVLSIGKTKGLSLFLTGLILPLILFACNITLLLLYPEPLISAISITLLSLQGIYVLIFAFQCLGHFHRLNLRFYYTFTSFIISSTLLSYLFGGSNALEFKFETTEILILSASILFALIALTGLIYFIFLLSDRHKYKKQLRLFQNKPLNE